MSKNSGDSFSVLLEFNTTYKATLSTGRKGCMKSPVTNVKHSRYRSFDLNKFVQSVVHSYHIVITERNNTHYQDMIQSNNCLK